MLQLPAAHAMIQAKLFLLGSQSSKMEDHGMDMELVKFMSNKILFKGYILNTGFLTLS